jgi:hypothetical protein
MALTDGISPTPNYPIAELTAMASCFVGYFALFALANNMLRVRNGIKLTDALVGSAVSTMHAIVCVATATATVLGDLGDIGVNGEEPLLGSIGLCASIAYFAWDIQQMQKTEYQPFIPLVIHHVLSGTSMVLVVFWVPRAVWYACILQLSEGTVPMYTIVAYLEWRGKKGTYTYAIAHWALLVTWLLLRVTLIAYFCYIVWIEWVDMTDIIRLLAMNGPVLMVFNLVALATVVIEGYPWTNHSAHTKVQ